MRKILFALGIGGLVYGTYRYYMLQSDILYYSKVKLADVKILKADHDNVLLNISLDVTNNSEFEFIIKKYDLAIFINNKKISNIQNSNLDERLKGDGATSRINFDVRFNPLQFGILDVFSQILKTLGQTIVSITGSLVVQKGVLTIDIPMDLTYKLKEFV